MIAHGGAVSYKRTDLTKTEYRSIHTAVRVLFGHANEYACFTGCCNRARDWACTTYYEDLFNYVPMCKKCHGAYDLDYENHNAVRRGREQMECVNGHPRTPGNVYMSSSSKGRPWVQCRVCHNERQKRYYQRTKGRG